MTSSENRNMWEGLSQKDKGFIDMDNSVVIVVWGGGYKGTKW